MRIEKRLSNPVRLGDAGESPVRDAILAGDLWRVHTTTPEAPVTEALKIMKKHDIGALVVVDEERALGIISERDCARKVLYPRKDPDRTAIKDVMSTEICSVAAQKKISECIDLMLRRHIRHLPVFFGRFLVGCVSLRYLVEYAFDLSAEGPGAKPATSSAEEGSGAQESFREVRFR